VHFYFIKTIYKKIKGMKMNESKLKKLVAEAVRQALIENIEGIRPCYQDETWEVFCPQNFAEMQKACEGTYWCVGKSEAYYNEYRRQWGEMYIIVNIPLKKRYIAIFERHFLENDNHEHPETINPSRELYEFLEGKGLPNVSTTIGAPNEAIQNESRVRRNRRK
jgi:hypothetical protein